MNITIHRASSRGHANHGWLDTYHTFSFANYFNPERMQFGALRVLNDDKVLPEEGFGTHPHKNMEVVSIPLKGRLRHGDSLNNSHTTTRGEIQVMSAGTGIHAFDAPAAGIDVTDDITHILFGHNDFYLHVRFEEYRTGFAATVLKAH